MFHVEQSHADRDRTFRHNEDGERTSNVPGAEPLRT
jgi:hypothetical protein